MACLSIGLSASLPVSRLACRPACQPAYQLACLPACQPACQPTCLPACLSADLLTSLPACLSAGLPTSPPAIWPVGMLACPPVCTATGFWPASLHTELPTCGPACYCLSVCLPACTDAFTHASQRTVLPRLYPPYLLALTACLGTLPPASAIASLPTISQSSPLMTTSVGFSQSLATLPALLTLGDRPPPPFGDKSGVAKPSEAVVLSSALPPIAAKLAAKIISDQFVAMKELLADNMTLCHQLESFPAQQHVFVGPAKPRLWEIDSPLTWVSCFLAYAAVCTHDVGTRDLLTYGRLVVREAQCHSGPGWLEYDRLFRQHAALSPSTAWNELNPSLHASTILSYRAGPGQTCSICHEPDHSASLCAMQALQSQPTSSVTLPVTPRPLFGNSAGSVAAGSPIRRLPHQETLERICVSWNRGRCSFASCKFRHICATCRQRGHKARDCQYDSVYKIPTGGPPANPGNAQV